MAASYIGRTATPVTQNTSQSSIAASTTLDSGSIQVGDEIILVMSSQSGNLAGTTPASVPSPPAGFSAFSPAISNLGSGSTGRGLYMWRKVADSSDVSAGSYSITFSVASTASSRTTAFVVVVRPGSGETITWRQGTPAAGGGASPNTSPSATGGNAGDLVLRFVTGLASSSAADGGASLNASTGAMVLDWSSTPVGTQRLQVNVTTNQYVVAFGTNPQATTGSAATKSVPMTRASDGHDAQFSNAVWHTMIAESATVGATAPTNTAIPTITTDGTPTDGEGVTGSVGTWTGTPAPTYAWEFRRNGSTVASGTGTSPSYTLVTADVGQNITLHVTATNSAGSAFADSTAIVPGAAATAPVNTSVPTITTDGSPASGEGITGSVGVWSGNPAPTYAWEFRRNATTVVASGTGTSGIAYTLVTADVGQSITLHVTATNSVASVSADSAGIIPSAAGGGPAAPANVVPPTITTDGSPQSSETVTINPGSWSGSPSPTFTYLWKRNGTTNLGTDSSYTLTDADIGQTITCTVTATNASGSAVATSPGIIPAAANSVTVDLLYVSQTTGLTGTVKLQMVNVATGAVTSARSSAGIIELVAGTGVYKATRSKPSTGRYLLIWDEGTAAAGSISVAEYLVP